MAILHLCTANLVATYANNLSTEPYLGEVFFPPMKKKGLNLNFIRGKKNLPIVLKPAAFDEKSPIRNRAVVASLQNEMPFFREEKVLSERDKQEMLDIEENGNKVSIDGILKTYYDDSNELIEGARAQAERIRMQLLSSAGKIYVEGNGQTYEYDYDPSGEYAENNFLALEGTNLWTDSAKAKPIEDIIKMMDKVETACGSRPTRMILNQNTYNLLINCDLFKANAFVNNGKNIITRNQVLDYFTNNIGITPIIYSKKFVDENGEVKSLFPDGVVTFVGETAVGTTWYGTTPEEAELISGYATKTQVSIVDTGIAVAVRKTDSPVNVITSCSEIVLPSYEQMVQTGVLQVI